MSHIPYTICRSGTYYYNRRVPKHAVKAYGLFIRQALSKCPEEAESYAKRLGNVLEGSWSRTTERVQPVDIPSVLASFKPRSFVLSEIAQEYLTLRDIDHKPPTIALSGFISLAGDRDVSEYTREDAKLFVRHLEMRGNKTATIRRRLKTRNSQRTLPLVGYAKLAMEKALTHSDDQYLFPRYIREGKCFATHASNLLNKWLKKAFDGLTAHCLRHTFRDRLRAVECPIDLIDQIGG